MRSVGAVSYEPSSTSVQPTLANSWSLKMRAKCGSVELRSTRTRYPASNSFLAVVGVRQERCSSGLASARACRVGKAMARVWGAYLGLIGKIWRKVCGRKKVVGVRRGKRRRMLSLYVGCGINWSRDDWADGWFFCQNSDEYEGASIFWNTLGLLLSLTSRIAEFVWAESGSCFLPETGQRSPTKLKIRPWHSSKTT